MRADNLVFYGNPKINELRITYHLTLNCNYKCDYCGIRNNKIKFNDYVLLQKFLNFIKDIDQDIKLYIIITGGEPTLHPHFLRFMIELITLLELRTQQSSLCLLTNITEDILVYKEIKYNIHKINFIMYPSYHKSFIDLDTFINKCKDLRKLNIILEVAFMIEDKLCINEFNMMNNIFKYDNDCKIIYKAVKDVLYKQVPNTLGVEDDSKELQSKKNKCIFFENNRHTIKHNRIKDRNFKGFICLVYSKNLLIEANGNIRPCFSINNNNFNLDNTYSDIINKNDKIVCTANFCAYEHSIPKFHWSHVDLLKDKEKCLKIFKQLPGWLKDE